MDSMGFENREGENCVVFIAGLHYCALLEFSVHITLLVTAEGRGQGYMSLRLTKKRKLQAEHNI